MSKQNARSMSITSQESYSAVMITDLVADVPVKIETEKCSEKPVKEETNLGYDGHLDGESKSPAEDGVDTTSSHITNGGGITRGVILNAVQFGQPDLKSKSEEKNIQLTTTLPVPSLTQQISEPQGFKDMSFLRKVAFGVSFLPSVLFVLCFSVILPCNLLNPCVQEMWVRTLNNTEPMSKLEVSKTVMFTAIKDHQSYLINMYKDDGIYMKTALPFDANSAYLKCGNIIKADTKDCIIMDGKGNFSTFNDTHITFVGNPISDEEKATEPVILTNSDGVRTEEIAIAVSNAKIIIMYNVTTHSFISITNCDSVPTKLTPWVINGSAAIVFVCKKNEEDKLVKIPQSMWYKKNSSEALILKSGTSDSLNNANILPVDEGLLLWSEDEVSMIQPNGSILWKFSDESHSMDNRFVFYGNFVGENKQVALLSSSISEFKVSLLDPADGNLIKSLNFSGFEAIDVVTAHTKQKDSILVLKKKTKQPTDILTALTQISNFTTIVNLVSNEEILGSTEQNTSYEVSFLDKKGELVLIKELMDLRNTEYKTTITAVYDESKDVLNIYLLSSSGDNATVETTKVRRINIANWNQSKKSKCLGTD